MSLATIKVSHLPSLAFEHRRELPAIGAVYFVLNSRLDVVYIGQAGNLCERWKSHHRAPQMQSGDYRIHWSVVGDATRRAAIERQAIDFFRPAWNNTGVPVADLKRVEAYINDVARYMEVDPRDLVCRILTEWAYNRREA